MRSLLGAIDFNINLKLYNCQSDEYYVTGYNLQSGTRNHLVLGVPR